MKQLLMRVRPAMLRLSVILLLALLITAGQQQLTSTFYTVSAEHLPEEFHGWRIIVLSDLHGTRFGPDNRRLLRAVERTQPDCIAITGDLVDDAAQLEKVSPLLPRLAALAPCYYVTGNHEWAAGCASQVKDAMKTAGITVLDNRWEPVHREGAQILVAGVEDPNGWADMIQPDELAEEIRQQAPEDFLLLLAHRNNWPERYPDLEADLIVCGHAHGGVIRIPGIGGFLGTDRRLFPRNTEGAIRCGPYTMVVSRGLGNAPGTLRIGNRPEIVVINLEKMIFSA